MDIGSEYIEMCQRAKEIQKLKQFNKNWEKGDWYFNEFYGTVHVYNEKFKSMDGKTRDAIWLPRQDQLQGIAGNYFCARMLNEFMSFAIELPESPFGPFYSWEMAWLCFVMKKRFGKVWNGEKWVKERKSKVRVRPTSAERKPKKSKSK